MSTPRRHGGHALLLAALLLAFTTASAQAPNDDYVSGQPVHVSTAMIALLAAVIAVFVFIALATTYLRHCTGYAAGSSDFHDGRAAIHLDHHAFVSWSRRQRRQRGLDPEVVETFPTMKYAEAKALLVGKGGALECAVCLSEFEDEERLRLLPRCSHAFHPDCIGEWLASHVTCPVCRCNLDPNHKDTSSDDEVPDAAPQPQAGTSVVVSSSETASLRQDDSAHAVVIDVVTEEEVEERRQEAAELQLIGQAMRSRSGTTPRLARAHSTGRSFAVSLDRDLERFTLRLPEHVRREMVAAGEHSLQSLRGRRAGEGRSRGGRSAPLGRAARWQSLLVRTFSGKVPSFFSASRGTVSSDGGEVSSTSSSRVRGKRVAAVDAADVHGNGGRRLDRIGSSPSSAKGGSVSHDATDEEKAATQQVPTT